MRFSVSLPAALILLSGAGDVYAQRDYPNKTIRIFTTEPGGAADIASRLIAQGISGPLGQPVVVENRAGGITAVEAVAKAPPDGYSMIHYGSTIWLLPFMRDNAPWEARDFAPVSLTITAPNLLVVHPSSGINSVRELVVMARAKPGMLNYAMGSRGTSTHLSAELFLNLTGVKITGVPYKGNVPGMNAVLGGEVQMVFPSAGSGGPFVKSGKLKALAVTSAEPTALFPGVPTMAEAGVPGYESVSIIGVLVPAQTPDGIIRRLNQEIVKFMIQQEVRDKFFNSGAEVVGSSPESFGLKIKSEMSRLGKIIRDVGIRLD